MSKWCKTAPLGVNTSLMDGAVQRGKGKEGQEGGGWRGKQRKLCLTDRKSVGHVGKIEGGQMSSRGREGFWLPGIKSSRLVGLERQEVGRDQFRPVANSFAEPEVTPKVSPYQRLLDRLSLFSRLLLYLTPPFTLLSLGWTRGSHVRWLTEECEFWVPQLVGCSVQTDVLRSPPTRGARVTWAPLLGWEPVFGAPRGDPPRHRMPIPSRGDNEERLRRG